MPRMRTTLALAVAALATTYAFVLGSPLPPAGSETVGLGHVVVVKPAVPAATPLWDCDRYDAVLGRPAEPADL